MSEDIENNKKSSSKKSGKRSKDKGEKGAIQDIGLPESFKEYGVPVDIGKRIITFSDVDRSVWSGVTELPYLPMPFNFILPSKSLFYTKIKIVLKIMNLYSPELNLPWNRYSSIKHMG